jgi:uncharacterized membrane protein YesL
MRSVFRVLLVVAMTAGIAWLAWLILEMPVDVGFIGGAFTGSWVMDMLIRDESK